MQRRLHPYASPSLTCTPVDAFDIVMASGAADSGEDGWFGDVSLLWSDISENTDE